MCVIFIDISMDSLDVLKISKNLSSSSTYLSTPSKMSTGNKQKARGMFKVRSGG